MHDSNYEALTQVSCRPARVKCQGGHLKEMDTGGEGKGGRISEGKGSP